MMDSKSLKVVPWFSTEEWDYVCKLVYSDSVVEQTKGYEHLLVWKARVGMLPASVTCTLELLQVHLQDQVLWPRIASGKVPPHAAQQLRLTYSTVIMRFLNHLASLFQNTKNQTLYSVAKKLHIPAWMVNIRHDAAHDGNVPSVDVLRLAAGYALSWLHEYWWKPESLSLLDWKPTDNSIYEDTSQVELCNILDLWQALALYQETDYSYVHQIPDKEVSTQVSILYSKMNNESHNKSKPDNEVEVTADYNCTRGMSINVASSLVLQYLKKFVGETEIFHDWDQILLNCLVGEGMFNASILSDEDRSCVENNKLPRRSLKMWEPVLASLPVAVLLHIIQKLLKLTCSVNGVISNQSRLAALWICELAKAIFKLQKVLNLVDEMNIAASGVSEPAKTLKLAKGISVSFMQDDNLAKLTSKSLRKMLFGRVETDCPDLKDDLVLDVKALPNKKETYEVVKFAVLNPSQLTPIFLPSVLKLMDLPAPVDTHSNLMLLVDLYTQFVNTDVEVDVDTPVFTVSQLTSSSTTTIELSTPRERHVPVSKDIGVEDMEVEERDHLDQQKSSQQKQTASKSHWCHAEANPKWSKCPLGVLPWQRGQIWVDLTIPEYTWQLSEDIKAVGNINKLPKLFHKAIEWEDVKRRRLKKKGNLKLCRKIVETALETVSQSTVGRCCTKPKNIP